MCSGADARAQRPAAGPIASDSAALGRLVDSVIAADLAALRIPGAVVTVVHRGRLVLARGYGVADLDRRSPMDPFTTVVRVGSITKPVTATAVLQLAQEGALRLDADVNGYLADVRVPSPYGRPVTVADLLTHTAGLDVRLSGTAAARDDAVVPLCRYVAADLPPVIRPPGTVLAYSNHGYALLGCLVEAVSGRDFETYVEERIFHPLGMSSSTFRFRGDALARAATGYEPRLPRYRRAAVVHPNIGPAAGLNTTAADMARFMMAHLGGGPAGGARILAESTVRTMHRRHFAQDPRVAGMTYGWFESFENGQRVLLHVGGIRGFMSGLYLWPEHELGLFVADNGYHPDLVRDLAFAVSDRLFPAPPRPTAPRTGASPSRHAGTYRLAAHPARTLEKAGALRRRGNELVIRDAGARRLRAFGEEFEPVAPALFRVVGGDETLAFARDSATGVERVVTTDLFYAVQVWERVPWYRQGAWHRRFLALAVAAFASVLLRPPRARARPSLLAAAAPEERPRHRRARRAIMTGAALFLLALGALAASLRGGDTGLLLGVPPLLRAALWIATAGAAVALTLPAWTVAIWRQPGWGVGGRVHFTAVALVAVAFVAFLVHWRLLAGLG